MTPSEFGELLYRLFSTGPELPFSFHYAPVQDAADRTLLFKDVNTYNTTHSASLQHSPVCATVYACARPRCWSLLGSLFSLHYIHVFPFSRVYTRSMTRAARADAISSCPADYCQSAAHMRSAIKAGDGASVRELKPHRDRLNTEGGKASNATNYAHGDVQ